MSSNGVGLGGVARQSGQHVDHDHTGRLDALEWTGMLRMLLRAD